MSDSRANEQGGAALDRARPTVTGVVRIMEARRELAQDSLRILFDGLRTGVAQAIDVGLRGLGVKESSEIYQRIGGLAQALSALRAPGQARLCSVEGEPMVEQLESSSHGLRDAIASTRAAAQRTAELTEQVSELLHQQSYAMEIAFEVLNDPNIPEGERAVRLNQFLGKQRGLVASIREVNRAVLEAQSFQVPLTETVGGIIDVIEALQGRLEDIEDQCEEPSC